MKTYLVGGAVRDELLGLPGGDRDHVVVGATPEMMRARGFRQVGRDFPVFLHPHTGEEHALARTERKSGRGHQGFVVHASPDVTLEQDLARRDFTINAIARDLDSGALIDPHGGAADIQHRVLRHVGAAFVEDPLRVLRAARFMARFAPLGFSIAPETVTLMRQVAAAGELESLSAERIWQELVRALRSARPSAFLASLRECGALARVLPEVDALYGVPQRADYHPEVDTGVHVEMVCDMAARLAPGDDLIGFAALTHDLGKALTPAAELPRHPLHESRGLKPLQALAERLRVPNEHRQLAAIVCREHLNVHRLMELKPATVLKILERADAFRKPMRIDQLASACEADSRGRAGHADTPYPQANELRRLFAAARVPRAAELADRHSGPALGEALRRARIRAIAEARDAASTSQAQADDADQTALHAEQASCRTHPIRRAAMQGYVDDIEKATEDNQDYRRVVYTGKHMQLVLMCLQPGEEIGEEVHEGHDQFFRFEEGSGEVQIDGQSHAVKGDFGVIVPAGARHNVINTGAKPMRLYTLYGPPEHRHDVVHASKADEQEEHFDGTTSE